MVTELRASAEQIRDFILDTVEDNPRNVCSVTGKRFSLSRQSVFRHLKRLVAKGLLEATGKTRARRYALKVLSREDVDIPVSPDLQEDVIWRERILPIVGDLRDNVLTICNHGFTEMVNNVISHSEGTDCICTVERNAVWTTIRVFDNGVGIFAKIQRELGLNDPRHALLELAKGKLTTDPHSHTGEGIFFTSRMFDKFNILSRTLFYGRTRTDEDEWLIETENRPDSHGTLVVMQVKNRSMHTVREVFDRYASGKDDYTFSRTHVPVKLAKYERDQLLSRSAARRVLARFEKFREVILDFQGVDLIGQAFADEIFRVFKLDHPEIAIYPLNTNPEIARTIQRAQENQLASV